MNTINRRRPAILSDPAIGSLPSRLLRPFELERLVRALAANDGCWRPLVRHDRQQRWYTRLHWTPTVEVWLLGWDVDQDTRLHDHGDSCGAFCVADGKLYEEYAAAGATRLRSRIHGVGSGASFDSRYMHNLIDRGSGPATSVHAYSPPLSLMRFYEPDEHGRLVASYHLPVAGPEPDGQAPPVLLGEGP